MKVTDALGNFTQMGYDGLDNLLSVRDAKNNLHQYGYDARNQLNAYTDPLLKGESSSYDANGNVISASDRKGQITAYEYDALNRLTKTTFHDGATISYAYDAGNRLTQIVDSVNGTISRQYDLLDRLTQETTAQGTLNYGYDAAGRRTSLQVAGQAPVSYGWDNANRLTQIAQGSNQVNISYDAANRRQSLRLPNGITQTYSYDDANQLTAISYSKDAIPLGDLTYEYDANGRRTKVGGSYARAELPAALTSTSHDAANRLTSMNATSLSYDDNGNLLSDGVNTYSWNARNQLTGISGSMTASFQYDALGRRKSKTIAGTSTSFLYDGANIVQELNGATPSANLLTGLNLDEVYARTQAANAENFLTDALGSTIALTDTAGAIQTSYSYEPYGKAVKSGSATTNAQTYTGREDDGTGLYYYRARYYHPTLQRFISEDPIGLAGGINVYAYVDGNPISLVDPDGLIGTTLGGLTRGNSLNAAVQQGAPFAATAPIAAVSIGAQGALAHSPGAVLALSGSAEAAGAAVVRAATQPGVTRLSKAALVWRALSIGARGIKEHALPPNQAPSPPSVIRPTPGASPNRGGGVGAGVIGGGLGGGGGSCP